MKVGADNSSVDIILMMILGESLIAGRVTFLVCHAKYSPYPSKHVFHSNRNASHPEVPWEEHSCIKTYSDPEELLCFPPPLVCKILIMKMSLTSNPKHKLRVQLIHQLLCMMLRNKYTNFFIDKIGCSTRNFIYKHL